MRLRLAAVVPRHGSRGRRIDMPAWLAADEAHARLDCWLAGLRVGLPACGWAWGLDGHVPRLTGRTGAGAGNA